MEKKKILFFITKATAGGAQKYVFDISTRLPRESYSVVVAYGEEGLLAKELRDNSIETRRIGRLGRDVAVFYDFLSFWEILTLLNRERPDVVHLNSSKAAGLASFAARIAGIRKIIFTVHGWPFKERRNAFMRALIWLASYTTAFMSHAVIVVSKTDEEIGRRMTFIWKKIRYIPLGLGDPQFLSKEEASSRLGLTQNDLRLVTIAELTANKGIRYAIEAISFLSKRGVDVSYFIIGDGEERERLQALARELNVADRVQFLGFVPNAALCLKAFDIFLLPSIKEGMPYALLEAAASGLPIAATDIVRSDASNLPNTCFVPPGDGQALAGAVEKLARDLKETTGTVSGAFDNMLTETIKLYN